jgi:hypothetical protein
MANKRNKSSRSSARQEAANLINQINVAGSTDLTDTKGRKLADESLIGVAADGAATTGPEPVYSTSTEDAFADVKRKANEREQLIARRAEEKAKIDEIRNTLIKNVPGASWKDPVGSEKWDAQQWTRFKQSNPNFDAESARRDAEEIGPAEGNEGLFEDKAPKTITVSADDIQRQVEKTRAEKARADEGPVAPEMRQLPPGVKPGDYEEEDKLADEKDVEQRGTNWVEKQRMGRYRVPVEVQADPPGLKTLTNLMHDIARKVGTAHELIQSTIPGAYHEDYQPAFNAISDMYRKHAELTALHYKGRSKGVGKTVDDREGVSWGQVTRRTGVDPVEHSPAVVTLANSTWANVGMPVSEHTPSAGQDFNPGTVDGLSKIVAQHIGTISDWLERQQRFERKAPQPESVFREPVGPNVPRDTVEVNGQSESFIVPQLGGTKMIFRNDASGHTGISQSYGQAAMDAAKSFTLDHHDPDGMKVRAAQKTLFGEVKHNVDAPGMFAFRSSPADDEDERTTTSGQLPWTGTTVRPSAETLALAHQRANEGHITRAVTRNNSDSAWRSLGYTTSELPQQDRLARDARSHFDDNDPEPEYSPPELKEFNQKINYLDNEGEYKSEEQLSRERKLAKVAHSKSLKKYDAQHSALLAAREGRFQAAGGGNPEEYLKRNNVVDNYYDKREGILAGRRQNAYEAARAGSNERSQSAWEAAQQKQPLDRTARPFTIQQSEYNPPHTDLQRHIAENGSTVRVKDEKGHWMEREVQQSDLDRQKAEYDRAWEGKGLTVPGKKPAKPSAPYAAPRLSGRAARRPTWTPATDQALALHDSINPEPQVDPAKRGMGEHGEWMKSQEAVHRNPETYLAENRPVTEGPTSKKDRETLNAALKLHDKLNKKPVVRDVTSSQPHDLERQEQVQALNTWHANRERLAAFPAEYVQVASAAEKLAGEAKAEKKNKLADAPAATPFAQRPRQSVSDKRKAAFRGEI